MNLSKLSHKSHNLSCPNADMQKETARVKAHIKSELQVDLYWIYFNGVQGQTPTLEMALTPETHQLHLWLGGKALSLTHTWGSSPEEKNLHYRSMEVLLPEKEVYRWLTPSSALSHFPHERKKFLASRHCILCDAFDNIDWGAVEKGLQSLILAFQVWAVNHLRRLCGTSNIVVPMGSWDNYTCPCFHM